MIVLILSYFTLSSTYHRHHPHQVGEIIRVLQLVTYDEEEWSSDNIQVWKNIHEHTNIDNDIDADIDAEIDYIDADDIVENDKHEDKDQVMWKTLV